MMIKMKLDNKGVASVDFLFATLIAVIIIGSLVSIISTETEIIETAELGRARMVGERIATTINTVYINGPGYTANVTIPEDIDMEVDVDEEGFLVVKYKGTNIQIPIIPRNPTAGVENIKTANFKNGESFQVTNNEGTLEFNKLD